MQIEAVRIEPRSLIYVPDCLKTQGICKEAVARSPYALGYVPDHLKMQEMCEKAVQEDSWLLGYVRDWFLTQQQVKLWHYDNDFYDDDDEIIKRYDSYQKRKAQKAKIKEELMRIAWNPSRWQDWWVSKDEKKQAEKLW